MDWEAAISLPASVRLRTQTDLILTSISLDTATSGQEARGACAEEAQGLMHRLREHPPNDEPTHHGLVNITLRPLLQIRQS
jgi:hypothetical protein